VYIYIELYKRMQKLRNNCIWVMQKNGNNITLFIKCTKKLFWQFKQHLNRRRKSCLLNSLIVVVHTHIHIYIYIVYLSMYLSIYTAASFPSRGNAQPQSIEELCVWGNAFVSDNWGSAPCLILTATVHAENKLFTELSPHVLYPHSYHCNTLKHLSQGNV